MKNNGLVSIIIPIYNVENYIKKCIESCVNQTYKNVEIILVDDGSTDSSGKIADSLKKSDNRIFVYHIKNGGVSRARNYGINKANGKYVCFVDSDDYLSDDFVSYMVELLHYTNSDFCFSKNCYISCDQKQVTKEKRYSVNSVDGTRILLSPYVEVGCWNKLYKAELLKQNAITFSTELFYGEGLDFICRVAQLSNRIGVGNRRCYFYRKNNLDSATTSFDYNKYINGEKSLLKIKNELRKTNRKLDIAWRLHYVLFSINALVGIISNEKKIKDFDSKKEKWNTNIRKNGLSLLFSFCVEFRHKIKIVLSMFCPSVLVYIKKKKSNMKIKKSV